jgi:hypothetical protein
MAWVSAPVHAQTTAFTIVDDSALNTAVAQARTEFNVTRGGTPRLHACLLVRQPDGTWRRGSFEGSTTSFAASTVKLPFLASAMFQARTTGRAYNWLDQYVRPMIVTSDNIATGEVVDRVTGAPNTTTGDYTAWKNKRLYTNNFLSGRGLLSNQMAINKTYPSNSGSSPANYENTIFTELGSNQLQPNRMAELMLEIVYGAIEPGATAYMRDMLTHDRFSLQSPTGWGVPPGSIFQNKGGWTSTVLNDVAYVKLPNGREFILAVYSNQGGTNDPGDSYTAALGTFMDLVIEKAGLDAGGPQTIRLDNTSSNFSVTGTWNTVTSDFDKYKTDYRWATGGTASTRAQWALSLPQTGRYEVSVWWTDDTARSSSARIEVTHAGGTSSVNLDQRTRGGQWVPVGTYQFNTTGHSVAINAGASATGRVIADGLRLQRVPDVGADIVVDNGGTGYRESGTWSTSASSGFFGTNSRFANVNSGASATFTPTLSIRRKYNVYAWYVAGSNRTSGAQYVVHREGGTNTVTVNQTTNGSRWVLLGAYDLAPGQNHRVVLNTTASNGTVVSSDAVRFVEAGEAAPVASTEVIVDNTDAGFTASTNWSASSSEPGFLGSNYRVRATASVSDSAQWTANLPSAGSYQVYARWTSGTNRAASAPYVISHTGGSSTVNVNQQTNNGTWVLLGTYNFNAGNNTVRLSCWTTAGFFVVADAVRFVKQ